MINYSFRQPRGIVLTVDLSPSVAQPAVLNSVNATSIDGTPTDAEVASANVGQTIELSGANLTLSTQVVFETIDSNGTTKRRHRNSNYGQ